MVFFFFKAILVGPRPPHLRNTVNYRVNLSAFMPQTRGLSPLPCDRRRKVKKTNFTRASGRDRRVVCCTYCCRIIIFYRNKCFFITYEHKHIIIIFLIMAHTLCNATNNNIVSKFQTTNKLFLKRHSILFHLSIVPFKHLFRVFNTRPKKSKTEEQYITVKLNGCVYSRIMRTFSLRQWFKCYDLIL